MRLPRLGTMIFVWCGLTAGLTCRAFTPRFSELSVSSSMYGSVAVQVSLMPFRHGASDFNLVNYEMIAFPNGASMESWRPEYRYHFDLTPIVGIVPHAGFATDFSHRFSPVVGGGIEFNLGSAQNPSPLRIFFDYRLKPYTQDAIGDNGYPIRNPEKAGHKMFIGISYTMSFEMGVWISAIMMQNRDYEWAGGHGSKHSTKKRNSGRQPSGGSSPSEAPSGHRNR